MLAAGPGRTEATEPRRRRAERGSGRAPVRAPAGVGLLAGGVGLVVAIFVVAQVVAAASVVLRFVQLLAVAAIAGWVGFKLGVLAERHRR